MLAKIPSKKYICICCVVSFLSLISCASRPAEDDHSSCLAFNTISNYMIKIDYDSAEASIGDVKSNYVLVEVPTWSNGLELTDLSIVQTKDGNRVVIYPRRLLDTPDDKNKYSFGFFADDSWLNGQYCINATYTEAGEKLDYRRPRHQVYKELKRPK